MISCTEFITEVVFIGAMAIYLFNRQFCARFEINQNCTTHHVRINMFFNIYNIRLKPDTCIMGLRFNYCFATL